MIRSLQDNGIASRVAVHFPIVFGRKWFWTHDFSQIDQTTIHKACSITSFYRLKINERMKMNIQLQIKWGDWTVGQESSYFALSMISTCCFLFVPARLAINQYWFMQLFDTEEVSDKTLFEQWWRGYLTHVCIKCLKKLTNRQTHAHLLTQYVLKYIFCSKLIFSSIWPLCFYIHINKSTNTGVELVHVLFNDSQLFIKGQFKLAQQ